MGGEGGILEDMWRILSTQAASLVCVECLIGKQKKPILFKVTEPSSIPYRTHPACRSFLGWSETRRETRKRCHPNLRYKIQNEKDKIQNEKEWFDRFIQNSRNSLIFGILSNHFFSFGKIAFVEVREFYYNVTLRHRQS